MSLKNQFTTEAARKIEAERAQKGPLVWMVPLTFLISAGDVYYTFLFAEQEILLRDWIVLKIITVSGLALITTVLAYGKKDVRLIAFLALFSLALGPFGPILFSLMLIFYFLYSLKASVFAEFLENLFPSRDSNPVLLLYERISHKWDDLSSKEDTIPYHDIMALGSTEQKQAALGKIGKDFKPELAEVLMEALNDKTNAVRVQVATTLAKLDRNFTVKIEELEKQHKEIPNDIGIIENVARLSFERAVSGVIEEDKIADLLKKAKDYYLRYLHFTDEARVKLLLAKVMLKLREGDEAKDLLEELLKTEDKDLLPAIQTAYIEALYDLNMIAELQKFCRGVRVENPDESIGKYQLLGVIKFWGSDEGRIQRKVGLS